MTFDEWWEDFVAEHDEWKYADSAALRRAAFQAGAASRDAEIEKLKLEIESSNFFEKQTAGERDHLREQLAEREKQVVLLWDALAMWNVASENSEESELDDMACYCVPMPLFCDADEAMGDALAKVRKP